MSAVFRSLAGGESFHSLSDLANWPKSSPHKPAATDTVSIVLDQATRLVAILSKDADKTTRVALQDLSKEILDDGLSIPLLVSERAKIVTVGGELEKTLVSMSSSSSAYDAFLKSIVYPRGWLYEESADKMDSSRALQFAQSCIRYTADVVIAQTSLADLSPNVYKYALGASLVAYDHLARGGHCF